MFKCLTLLFLTTTAFAGDLQNSDFATSAQITGAGGTVAQLLNSSKMYNTVDAEIMNTSIARWNAKLSSPVNLTTQVTGVLPFANGGTNVAAVPTSASASNFAAWDANVNLSANSFIEGYATTATAAGTTTLVVGSAEQQYFTGATTQTVKLPVTSTLVLGQSYQIVNLSSGVVTVQSSGANTLQAMAANSSLVATVISTAGTGTASWSWSYGALTGSGGTVTSVAFADGSSTPIYTITGSPVTTSGTLTETLATQSANTVFSGPTSGGAAQPTFRALVAADIPSTFSYGQEVPSGTVNNSNVTFTLAHTPKANAAVSLYLDGLILNQGVDYTLSSVTITMTTAPNFNQKIYATYQY